MIITRGFTGKSVVTRGYAQSTIARIIYAEVLRFKSYMTKLIEKTSRVP